MFTTFTHYTCLEILNFVNENVNSRRVGVVVTDIFAGGFLVALVLSTILRAALGLAQFVAGTWQLLVE